MTKDFPMRLTATLFGLALTFALFPASALSNCRYSKHDFPSILRCAEQSDARAQKELAGRYLHGEGVAQSATEALRWYQQSAEGGLTESQYTLGYLYQRGLGIRRSDSSALIWYHRAAVAGYADAQFNLATLLLTSSEIPKRPDEAAIWYRKAVDRGDADSANNLGYLYETGSGVRQDLNMARQYYRRAAQANNSQGQYNLGRLLIDDSSNRTREEGRQWLERSAKNGFAPAMAALGRFLAESTPPNQVDAFYWFTLAAAMGDPAGKTGRAIVSSDLTDEQMDEVYRRLNRAALSIDSSKKSARRRR